MEQFRRIPWRARALIVGGVLGALTGLGAAYMYVQAAEKRGETASFKATDGVKVGLLVLGLMRSVARLSDGK